MSSTLERVVRLRKAGELEEARAILLNFVERSPEDPAVNYQCAWIHDRMGRGRNAIPFYEHAIERGLSGGNLEGAILSLGSSYRAVGNYAKAAEVLRGGVARFPITAPCRCSSRWTSATSASTTRRSKSYSATSPRPAPTQRYPPTKRRYPSTPTA